VIGSALVLAAAAALAAALVAPAHGLGPAAVTAGLVAGLGGPALATAHALAAARRRFGSLRREFVFAAVVALGVILLTVVATALLMFVSDHDALLVSAIVLAAGLVAFRIASLVALSVATDVTAVRDALGAVGTGQRELHVAVAAQDEIGELARSAGAMVGRLAEEERRRDAAESARRRLVAAVSHDLRTPLASLRLLVEAIDDDIVDEGMRRRYLATMQTHVRSLSAMIDDLFELSRIEAGDIEWSIRQIRVKGLVQEAVEAMGPEARASSVKVRTDLQDPVLVARADPEKIQRVLFNLIRNAIRHTPADGSVTVRAEATGPWVEIEVTDTGEGIVEEERGQVFDPFFRGGSGASRGSDGAGLGLAISRAIVETHGGRIWLPASEGGTRVRFSLPAG
jgi:signal transduction histidine kinase